MKNNEQTFNIALGAVLQTRRHGWRDCVASEMNGGIVGGGRVDNLIYPAHMQPVAVEAAFAGTVNIDGDAIGRLGCTETKNEREIMTAVAVCIPTAVRVLAGGVDGIKKWLQQGGKIDYAVYSLVKGSDDLPAKEFDVRYPDGVPNSGYIRGTAGDLADLIELAATPDKKIKHTAERVGGAVRGVAALMYKEIHPYIRGQIAEKVGQPADLHALRVAACVWLNALTLHHKLAKFNPDTITPIRQCETWRDTMNAWSEILEIDYRSVFRPALESLQLLSEYGVLVKKVLLSLRQQVELIDNLYLGGVTDISSDMFPELATDRKVTAAFYTRMEVAELLAGVAFNFIPNDGRNLKIADFACGTGALLKAAYRQVRRRAEGKQQNMQKLHQQYMEECLHGADIQPIAAHLTAAGLAGMHADSDYRHSNIICADVRDGKTGSLDLLKSESLHDLFGGEAAAAVDDGQIHDFRPADNTFDLCIMNPPYSRSRGGIKVFDMEGLKPDERKKSVDELGRLLSKTFASMKAGMASAFCVLADKKLRDGGVLATVLPLTAAGQGSWRKFRAHIMQNYSEVVVIGMASNNLQSFSADTGMGEMLVCARKGGNIGGDLTFINLHYLPRDFVEANETARAIRNIKTTGEIKIGAHVFATCIKTRTQNGDAWGAAAVKSSEMALIAEALTAGKVTTLGLVHEYIMPITVAALSAHVKTGPTHHLIGHMPNREPIGAFAFRELRSGDRVNLSLWEAKHKKQTCLICAPTHRGELVAGRRKEAKHMLAQQSIVFVSRNLSMASQKLASAMTETNCMGGRAWTALILQDNVVAAAYCLWFNSILGLMCRWQCGGRQHPGRAQMQLGDIGKMPCPNFSAATVAARRAVKIANAEFSRLAKLELMPCSLAWRDNNRHAIDATVLRMLGLDKKVSAQNMQELREAWCCEPSVHGGNKEIIAALIADGIDNISSVY